MGDLELTRAPEDRRLYALQGVGTLRLEGWGAPRATAETGARSWHFARRGVLRRTIDATDAFGGDAGTFKQHRGRRGGTLRWDEDELALRPASLWRERYALADGDRELVVLDGKGWGKQPVKVTVDDGAELDPGLVLFATFVVRGLADDAGAAAASAAASAGS
jgi:hypothetical protein